MLQTDFGTYLSLIFPVVANAFGLFLLTQFFQAIPKDLEDSARMQESRYVALFNDADGDIEIALRRQALGVRWDYTRRQALTFELSHIVSLTQTSNELRAQWSAAIP